MNYLKRTISFVLLLTLLNSSSWCMESIINRETGVGGEKEIEEILNRIPSLKNLCYFMCCARSCVPHFNADSIGYIANILCSLVLKDSLEYNFTLFKTVEGSYYGWIYAAAVSSDGKTVVTGSPHGELCLWNAETKTVLTRFQGHSGCYIFSVAFSPNGETFATGSSDSTVRFWDSKTGKFIRYLEGHTGFVWSVAFSPNGTVVASGSSDCSMAETNRT